MMKKNTPVEEEKDAGLLGVSCYVKVIVHLGTLLARIDIALQKGRDRKAYQRRAKRVTG